MISDLSQGVPGLILSVLAIILGVYWLLFPWFVYAKLDRIIAILGKIEKGQGEATERLSAQLKTPTQATALPPVPGEELYFVQVGKEMHGPQNIEALQTWFTKELITKDSYVIKQGDSKWQRFGDVFEKA